MDKKVIFYVPKKFSALLRSEFTRQEYQFLKYFSFGWSTREKPGSHTCEEAIRKGVDAWQHKAMTFGFALRTFYIAARKTVELGVGFLDIEWDRKLIKSLYRDMKVWNNPQTRVFCWFGCSSSGVDPVVSSHTRSCRHFTGCTPPKQNKITHNRGWKEEIDKRGFRTAKRKKMKWALFSILCMFVHGYREKGWLIWPSSSLLCVFVLPHAALRLLCSGVSLLTD